MCREFQVEVPTLKLAHSHTNKNGWLSEITEFNIDNKGFSNHLRMHRSGGLFKKENFSNIFLIVNCIYFKSSTLKSSLRYLLIFVIFLNIPQLWKNNTKY